MFANTSAEHAMPRVSKGLQQVSSNQVNSHLGGLCRLLAVRQMQTEMSGSEHHQASTDSATPQPPLCGDQMPPCNKKQQSVALCPEDMQAAPS